jgi:hypothetical protein
MSDDKNKDDQKNTVGQVGSGLAGGFEENKEENTTVTNNDLKGKKVDANPENPAEKPSDQ